MQSHPTIPFGTLLKTIMVVSGPSLLALSVLAIFGKLEFNYFVYAYSAIIGLSFIFVVPLLINIATLTHYVNDLAQDKRVRSPDLSFLSNVGELSGALVKLQRSWENKRQEMETVITEREILVDTLPDILIMTNNDQVIVRTNRAARNIFGQNLANRRLQEIIPNEKLINAITAVGGELTGQTPEFYMAKPQPRGF